MPSTVDEWITLMDLEQTGEGEFTGAGTFSQRPSVFGGQVLAQALGAAYRTVEPNRNAHSLSAYFLRPGYPRTPITYRVEAVRDGVSFSFRRVSAHQGDRVLFSSYASFHVNEPGLTHADQAPTGVPQPDDCPPLSEVLGARSRRDADGWQEEFGAVDVRFAGDTSVLSGQPAKDAAMKVWIRSASVLPGDPRIHQAFLAYASDLTLLAVSTVPHPVVFGAPGMQTVSINHAMWFHRPARADQWLLYDEVSPSASMGLGFGFGRIFSGGQLAASCAQEGLIRITDMAELTLS